MSGALTLAALITALAAAGWAGLLALAEQAPDSGAPGSQPSFGSLPLPRVLHVSRLALLVLAGVAASESVGWWNRPVVEGWGLALLAGAFIYMVADALPRAIGALAPDAAVAGAGIARQTLLPFRPLLSLVIVAERAIEDAVPMPGGSGAAMGPAHRDMLLGVFALGDMTVEEVMTPRLDIAAVEAGATFDEVLAALRRTAHARVPVYSDTLDNIVGIVHAKDLVPWVAALRDDPDEWASLVRPADFIPESKTLAAQLRDFQRGPSHLAIVVDEFGGTSGLMTLEDILEEIVGEIRDERDTEEVPLVNRDGNGRFWVDGGVSLEELSTLLGFVFDREEVSTVGGLIYSELGRVPASGEQMVIGDFRVVVEEVVKRRVRRVFFERMTPAAPAVAEQVE